MIWKFSVPFALVLASAPGPTFATSQSAATSSQQQQPAVENSHSLLPATVEPADPAQARMSEQSPASSQDLYRKCILLISQVREKAREVVRPLNSNAFNPDQTIRQHKELMESLETLKQEHESFYQALTPEQQKSIAQRKANLMQAQSRLMDLAKEMDRELSDSTLHTKDVQEQARTTQREMKSYQKEFRSMGSALGMTAD